MTNKVRKFVHKPTIVYGYVATEPVTFPLYSDGGLETVEPGYFVYTDKSGKPMGRSKIEWILQEHDEVEE